MINCVNKQSLTFFGLSVFNISDYFNFFDVFPPTQFVSYFSIFITKSKTYLKLLEGTVKKLCIFQILCDKFYLTIYYDRVTTS